MGPIWPQPGHPDNSITVFLGYGRTKAGRVGTDVGFSGYKIRTSDAPWFAEANIKKVGSGFGFAHPQGFQYIDHSDLPSFTEPLQNRHVIRKATLADFIKNPNFAHEGIESPGPEMTLYTNYQYTELKWGMTIDMNACVGCKTCIVACQAENNIPGGRQRADHARPPDAMAARRCVLRGRHRESHNVLPAGAVPAVRERALRSGLPGGRHGAQHRRPERHGVQPLRRHALLLQQLSVQGAPLQLPAVPGFHHAAVQDDAQSRSQRAQPRRHGEVHVLRAAHHARPHHRGARESQGRATAK